MTAGLDTTSMDSLTSDLLMASTTGAFAAGLASVHLPAVMVQLTSRYAFPGDTVPDGEARVTVPPRLPAAWVVRVMAVVAGFLCAGSVVPFLQYFLVDAVLVGSMAAPLVGACVVDAFYRRLPNALLGMAALPAVYVAGRYLLVEWSAASGVKPTYFYRHAGEAVGTALAVTLIAFLVAHYGRSLGMGDVKLIGVLMIWLLPFGPDAMAYTMLVAGVLVIVWGLTIARHDRRYVPMGPALGIGALICTLATAVNHI